LFGRKPSRWSWLHQQDTSRPHTTLETNGQSNKSFYARKLQLYKNNQCQTQWYACHCAVLVVKAQVYLITAVSYGRKSFIKLALKVGRWSCQKIFTDQQYKTFLTCNFSVLLFESFIFRNNILQQKYVFEHCRKV